MSYNSEVLADSPSAWWKFGEPSGTAANDEIGTNDGTYVDTPTLGVTGPTAGTTAVTFNGSSEYVTVGDDTAIDLGDTFSIEFWLKRAAISTNMVVIQKGTGTGSGYQVWINSGNSINLADGAGNNLAYVNTAVSDTTTWHHVVFTKSGSTRACYLDGVADTGLGTNATLADNTSGLTVASENAGGNYFSGSVGQVAVYKTALSSTRVAAHWAARNDSSANVQRFIFG